MLKCPSCGSFNYDEARFCVQCGQRLAAKPPEPPAPQTGPTTQAGGADTAGVAATQRFSHGKRTLPGDAFSPFGSQAGPAPVTQGGVDHAQRAAGLARPAAAKPQPVASGAARGTQPEAPRLSTGTLSKEPQRSSALPSQPPGQPLRTAGPPDPPARGGAAPTGARPEPVPDGQAKGTKRKGSGKAAKQGVEARPAEAMRTEATPAQARPSGAAPGRRGLPFGDLLDEVDHGFDKIVTAPGPAETSPTSHDLREVRQLFVQIAAEQMLPVRDFIIELNLGEPPREWLDVVLPSVGSLRKSANGMGLTELCAELDGFIQAIEVASGMEDKTIRNETRARLQEAYARLVEIMPHAFRLDDERGRREPVIVQSLLRQVPDVRKVALDKLYAAGLTRLEMYFVAKPYDIAEAAGISVDLAGRIVERFARYKREVASTSPEAGRAQELASLAELARRLAEQNSAFERANRDWSSQAARDKRRLRNERSETILELNVLLARLGEVDLVSNLERLPFAQKVGELERYLGKAKSIAAEQTRVQAGKKGRG